jgi:hypothetical protein
VRLTIDGAGDWFRKTRIEVSTDEASWARLAEGAYVFRVASGGAVESQTTLRYPVSDARYLRVTLLPGGGPTVRITGATTAWVPPESLPPTRLLPTQKPTPVPEPGDARASSWTVDLGAPGVPIAELALEIADPAFQRRALLAAANHQAYWAPVGATLLYRVPRASSPVLENLRLPAADTRKRYLRITIYNDDDAPLDVRAASPSYLAEEIVFRAAQPGVYTLYIGGELPAPSYDLPAVLARSNEEPTATAHLGTVTPNPQFGHLAPAAPPPWSERFKLPIAVALSLLVAALALWTVRLMRRSRSS